MGPGGGEPVPVCVIEPTPGKKSAMDQLEKLELEAHRDQFAAYVLGIGNRRFAEIGIADNLDGVHV
jgi:hypothetical protein